MPKQGEIARRPAWPEDTVFRRLVLDVESDSCEHCGATLQSATIVSTASIPCRAPWSCPVAWFTAPTAFARFAAKSSTAELLLGFAHFGPPHLRAHGNSANLLRTHRHARASRNAHRAEVG